MKYEQVSEYLIRDVADYIQWHYGVEFDEDDNEDNGIELGGIQFKLTRKEPSDEDIFAPRRIIIEDEKIRPAESFDFLKNESAVDDKLLKMLDNLDDNFVVTLLKLIDAKGMDDVECYKRANVSKQTWYKIMNEKNYKPSKNTVIAFAIALRLNLDEAKKLLETVGFALSRSSKFDVIIEYFIEKQLYDIDLINAVLYRFDQVCLGV